MKKSFSIAGSLICVGMMSLFPSCSNEADYGWQGQDTGGWHSAGLRFNVYCSGFDGNAESTRASGGNTWSDGDIVYLLLTDKDGGKVQAYVKYDGATGEWGEVMYEGYKSYLSCTTERVAEAYFIEGANDVASPTISVANTQAIYACTDGTYMYPADGDMAVSVQLQPLTGRIRFHGTAGQTASVSGVKTYTQFSCTTGKLTESVSAVSTTVAGTGYTPYIYCLFTDESNPTLTVTTDKPYRTAFDASASVLTAGSSGYLDLPTAESHRGWKTIVAVTGVSLDRTSLSLNEGETATLVATVLPEDATDRSVTWSSSDPSVATVSSDGKVTAVSAGTATITATSVSDTSVKATCTVTVNDGFANGHEYVDLGLTSGNLWATCNVGATSPEEYGNYYAWGETTTKSSYTESNYSYSSNPTTLPADRDAARANWGGNWSMPTLTDFQELYNECTWTWTTMNGKNGYKVSSRKNSSYIFLPAAGYFGSSLGGYAGSNGNYWSSSLHTSDTSDAYVLNFGTSRVNPSNGYYRYNGQSVRPVLRKEVAVTGITLDKTSLSLNKGETATLIATVLPENATDKSVTWSSSNKSVATVSSDGKVTAVSAGTTTITVTSVSDTSVKAMCTVTVTANSGGQENGHEYVDLGLSVLWATCNLGADRPEDYGDYFAWAETAPKISYDWSNYKWCKGNDVTLTKYCPNSEYGYNGFVDNKITIDSEDDAAYVILGGNWRLPTPTEFDELRSGANCTWTWCTMNGIKGYKVESKKSGYIGNYIFLPAGGAKWNSGYGYSEEPGSYGAYWSSSLDIDTDHAYIIRTAKYQPFTSSIIYTANSTRPRSGGLTVRPVCSK